MKHMIIPILCGICAMLAVSCGSQDGTVTETQSTTSNITETEAVTETAKLSDSLAEANYNGEVFHIFGEYQVLNGDYFDVEEETGDVIEDSVFRRNRLVEEKYNIDFEFQIVNQWEGKNLITTYIQSGDNTIDLFTNTYLNLGSLLVENYFVDWTQIDSVDLSLPCYVHDANNVFSIGNKMPLLFGEFMETNLLRCWNFFFNKRLLAEYDLPNPYEVVYNDQWTLDYFQTLIKDISKDLNGDSVMDGNDLYGFATDRLATLDAFTRCCDMSAIAKDKENFPTLNYFNDNVVSAFEKIYSLYYETPGTFATPENVWHIDNMFAIGNAIFASSRIDFSMNDALRSMQDEYGVLPYPKLDESISGYPTYLSGSLSAQMIGVTQDSDAYDMIGTITQALNVYGYELVVPAVYEVTLKTKNVYDEDSVHMLDIIRENRKYSFDACDEQKFPLSPVSSIRNLIGSQKSKDIASYYEKYKSKAQDWIDKMIASYDD